MIWFLALILFVLLITVGGERGASAVLALCGNIGVLALTVLLLASGKPPLLIIPVAAVLISYLTLMKQNGSNLKTKTAFLTVAVVMAVLSVGICVGVWKTGSAGLNEIQAVQEDVQFYYTTDLVISMQQVAVGVVLLSALGAVMDTALSVTSAVYEVAVHRKDLDRSAYFRSGIEVGKEIIGTTVNTLVFAYLGESLMLFAYLEKNGYSPEMMLNSKVLFQNIAVMLLGITACLLSVPVAAYLVAWKVGHKGEEDK